MTLTSQPQKVIYGVLNYNLIDSDLAKHNQKHIEDKWIFFPWRRNLNTTICFLPDAIQNGILCTVKIGPSFLCSSTSWTADVVLLSVTQSFISLSPSLKFKSTWLKMKLKGKNNVENMRDIFLS